MRNQSFNRKQLILGLRMALTIGIAEFLVMTLLGMLGLWSLVVEGFAIAIALSLMALLALAIRHTIQPTYPMYEPITYTNRFFPYTLALFRDKKRMERVQNEDFKPFVFKENRDDEWYK